ncbi:MAG TPA: HD domain-containing protein [Dictyobacter sp.]|jgi:uncharacterized protein|nr:HD domain-containing protein [Dictyobacter sp.]
MEEISQQNAIMSAIYREAQQRFSTIIDLAHGWEHINRVYQMALYIAEQEGGDLFIVGVAALLHDLGRTVQEEEQKHHADASVTLAQEIFQRYAIPAEQQEAILHAILAHSFSRGVQPQTLEASIVRDADRLDALGAIGILRWAVVGEQRSTAVTRSYAPTDPLAEHRTLDDKIYMLDHFSVKLFKLAETMTTRTGQQIAQQRTEFMRTYVNEFYQEVSAGDTTSAP